MIDDKTTRAPCGWIFKIRVGRAIDDAEGMTSIGCLPAALLVRELVISSQTLHSVEDGAVTYVLRLTKTTSIVVFLRIGFLPPATVKVRVSARADTMTQVKPSQLP